jgi:UDP-2,3-diacylglucosamine pyrophosphatase LpxH
MTDQRISEALADMYSTSPGRRIGNQDKIIIFSDLHLGDGSKNDDFSRNARLFETVLREYYLEKEFSLILNGDIEELQKFRLSVIVKKWCTVYELFSDFWAGPGLIKIVGNHDSELCLETVPPEWGGIYHSFRLHYGKHDIFLFHGHQASKYFQRYNKLAGWLLKFIVRPLRIKNISVSHSSKKQYKTERRVYDFSSRNKIVSIIGHTHRPLFESLSKADSLKYKIEHYLRRYSGSARVEKERIGNHIRRLKRELSSVYASHPEYGLRSSLYNREIIVPSLFNSGCVIGKRGITGIEIREGKIALVHWFDRDRSNKYFNYNGLNPEPLANTGFFRMVLKEDSLDYIFSRIELLA